MPTNLYTNNYDDNGEQDLIESLITESIQFYGTDVYWLPRSIKTKDSLYGEDTLSEFNLAVPIEMYIKNVEGFEGEGDFLSRFGLDIRDQMTFTLSIRRFRQEALIYNLSDDYSRPHEGDLIWFPMARERTGHMFEIKFVEHESMFYPVGTLPVFDLRCESFVYSNEVINTDILDINDIYTNIANTYLSNTMPSAPGDDNVSIETEASKIVEPSDSPFGDF